MRYSEKDLQDYAGGIDPHSINLRGMDRNYVMFDVVISKEYFLEMMNEDFSNMDKIEGIGPVPDSTKEALIEHFRFFQCPMEEVPLGITEHPDVVRWRLLRGV